MMITGYKSEEFNFQIKLKCNEKKGNIFTVIIGKNGCGKSRLLGELAENLINDNESVVESNPHKGARVVAISNLFTDQFPLGSSPSKRYAYSGLRGTSNGVFYSMVPRLTVGAFMDISADLNTVEPMKQYLNSIGYRDFQFTQPPRRISKKRDLLFSEMIGNLLVKDSDTATNLKSLGMNAREIRDLAVDLQQWYEKANRSQRGKRNDIGEEVDSLVNISLRYNTNPSSLYVCLNLIKYFPISITLKTENSSSNFDFLSVGQQLLISMIARILANANSESIVLIDEPEVGLHPNWQQSLIQMIKEVIHPEARIHFLISTHSPFIALDADQLLVPGENSGEFIEFSDPFRGRTIENILYRVFESPSPNNSLVGDDVQNLLEFVANISLIESSRVEGAIRRLSRVADEDTEELNELIHQARRMLTEI